MKNKKYLQVTITTENNTTFENPLKLGEIVLLSQILKENKKIEAKIVECSLEQYKQIFG